MTDKLASQIFELSQKYLPQAIELLQEVIAIPGESNTEGPRLQHLQERIEELDAADRTFIDDFGNLTWMVGQGSPVIYFDGHTDTVGTGPMADWEAAGLHPYNSKVDNDGWIWGRGSSDQLSGVVNQVFATKIIKELGLATNFQVVSVGTACEEDNDGTGPRYIFREGIPSGLYPKPDVWVLTEGTGDMETTPLGIYRGHRGRMEIVVETFGRSCHGSNPDLGDNAIVMAAAIVKDVAALQDEKKLKDDAFLGRGSITISRIQDNSASNNCVAPYCRIVLDRRLTVGEDRASCVGEIQNLPSVKALGEKVKISVLHYHKPTWTGYDNDEEIYYPAWATAAEDPAILKAIQTYKAVLAPHAQNPKYDGVFFEEPRVARWIFSSDGVGVPNHIPTFGFSSGLEQLAHTIEERVDSREMLGTTAFLAYYPWLFANG